MKNATRILMLAASLALLLALVSTANAAPGKCNPKKEDCSTTTTTPTPTTTVVPGPLGVGLSCADYAALHPEGGVAPLTWNLDENSTFPVFEAALTSGANATCIDVLGAAAGSYTVEVKSVDPQPKRNSILYTLVKDSHPGDHCGTAQGEPGSALNLNLTNETDGTINNVPAATLNACGTDYTETDVEWNSKEAEWVIIPTTTQDDTPDPLAIMLGITGKPGITANITLTYTADDSA